MAKYFRSILFWSLIFADPFAQGDITDIGDITKCFGLGFANLTQIDLDGITDVFDTSNPSIHRNTTEMIKAAGCKAESYFVQTADHYILNIFRIVPNDTIPFKGVVLMQHGLLSSSDGWLFNYKHKNLAYLLHKAGYDVWLGNNRGNVYSRNHKYLNPNLPFSKFWDFSWHEMGLYDMDATIHYILNKTGADDLFYIGHSQGTTQYFAGMSLNPALNSKIRLMVALAPPVFMGQSYSAIAPLALVRSPGLPDNLLSAIGTDGTGAAFATAQNVLLNSLLPLGCSTGLSSDICMSALFLIMGFDHGQLQSELVPAFLGHFPQGSSMKCLVHYLQLIKSNLFGKFDYGPGVKPGILGTIQIFTDTVIGLTTTALKMLGLSGIPLYYPSWVNDYTSGGNPAMYGSDEAPNYDLSQVTAPVVLYVGPNDPLAVAAGVEILAPLIPGNIDTNTSRRINYNCFNHIDFITADDINELLNYDVLALMESY